MFVIFQKFVIVLEEHNRSYEYICRIQPSQIRRSYFEVKVKEMLKRNK